MSGCKRGVHAARLQTGSGPQLPAPLVWTSCARVSQRQRVQASQKKRVDRVAAAHSGCARAVRSQALLLRLWFQSSAGARQLVSPCSQTHVGPKPARGENGESYRVGTVGEGIFVRRSKQHDGVLDAGRICFHPPSALPHAAADHHGDDHRVRRVRGNARAHGRNGGLQHSRSNAAGGGHESAPVVSAHPSPGEPRGLA